MDHFSYSRLACSSAVNIIFHRLTSTSNPSTAQGYWSSHEKRPGLYYRQKHRLLKLETDKNLRAKVCVKWALTLHRRARGLGEQRDKQQIDEVDEGEAIVPEQASCRDKETRKYIDEWSLTTLRMHLSANCCANLISLNGVFNETSCCIFSGFTNSKWLCRTAVLQPWDCYVSACAFSV